MDNFRTLISFTYPHEAHLAKGYLESNGIETFIENEFTVQTNNFYSNAVGGVKLLVNEADYEEGVKHLKAVGYITEDEPKTSLKDNLFNNIPDIKPDPITGKKACPFCKSENIGRNKKLNAFMVPLYFILHILVPVFRFNFICFDCGKQWRFKK